MVAVSELSTDSGLMSGSDRAYVVGRIQPVLEEITISEFFARTVSLYPDREACVFCKTGERWTWSQLSQKVDQFAAGLLALGIYKGDRVGIWSPNTNTVSFVYAQCEKSSRELVYLLRQLRPSPALPSFTKYAGLTIGIE
jgi:acyl-CoA synthetase (AMP-forming)/AMP-acid ligase II